MTVSLRDEGSLATVTTTSSGIFWFITVTYLANHFARPRVLLHFLALSAEIVLLTQVQAVSAGCTTTGLVFLETSRAENASRDPSSIRFLGVSLGNTRPSGSGTASGVMRSTSSLLLVR